MSAPPRVGQEYCLEDGIGKLVSNAASRDRAGGGPHRPKRPRGLRLINTAGRVAGRVGLWNPRFDEEALLTAARRATCFDDFGPESFREGLRQLIASLEHEAELTLAGWLATRDVIVNQLVNRLRLVDHRKCHPELATEEIRRPLFVIGLPRTGTTILYELLVQLPGHRAPLSWELAAPCPPPEAATYESDPRMAETERVFDQIRRLAPHFEAIHPIGARLPQECLIIQMIDFHSIQFHVSYNVPTYQDWLEHQDLRPTYRFHHDVLQHLQSRNPGGRWILKSPAHLLALDALLDVYPDAMIVQTHRDPVEVMASVSSLHCALRSLASDAVDPRTVGRQQVELWSRLMTRAISMRDRVAGADERFFDIHFEDLLADPVDCVRRICRHFQIEFTAEARLQRFMQDRPRDKHGVHAYTPAMFGLDPRTVSRRFDDYRERFHIRRGSWDDT